MFLHSTREGDHPNQIQHPENIEHTVTNAEQNNVIFKVLASANARLP
jgi:hypothetical protein